MAEIVDWYRAAKLALAGETTGELHELVVAYELRLQAACAAQGQPLRKGWKKDEFIVLQERVALIVAVERPGPQGLSPLDLGRYTIQYVDGSTLSNAPGYLFAQASDDEVKAALRERERSKGQ